MNRTSTRRRLTFFALVAASALAVGIPIARCEMWNVKSAMVPTAIGEGRAVYPTAEPPGASSELTTLIAMEAEVFGIVLIGLLASAIFGNHRASEI